VADVPPKCKLASDLRVVGYEPDPYLGMYTGFEVKLLTGTWLPKGRFRFTAYALAPAR
jgi:hypothetical protein